MSYNRRKVIQVLGQHGVVVVREGSGHTIVRSVLGRQSSLPRHPQVDRYTTRAVVRQLGLDWDVIKKDLG